MMSVGFVITTTRVAVALALVHGCLPIPSHLLFRGQLAAKVNGSLHHGKLEQVKRFRCRQASNRLLS